MRVSGLMALAHVLPLCTAVMTMSKLHGMLYTGRSGMRLPGARSLLTVALSTALLLPTRARAQGGDGFLFQRPSVQLSVRGSYFVPRANSEVFDFTRDQLTVDKSDFNTLGIGAEIAIRLSERTDVAVGFGYGQSETRSEFRDFIGTDDLPIEQTTTFARVPVTASVKYYLGDRGRSVSRLAWIPSKVTPYVGAGGGFVWYEFKQAGEFVDFNTFDIFNGHFRSDGVAPTVHGFVGADLSIGGNWVLTGEARYSFADVEMDRDFVDFDDIDLAGFQVTVGLGVRF